MTYVFGIRLDYIYEIINKRCHFTSEDTDNGITETLLISLTQYQ